MAALPVRLLRRGRRAGAELLLHPPRVLGERALVPPEHGPRRRAAEQGVVDEPAGAEAPEEPDVRRVGRRPGKLACV